jgi:ParB-like chromosome segregation protein Spo0J
MITRPRTPALGDPPSLPREFITLDIHRIRRDGDTQGRVALSESVIREYSDLMRMGVEFPPVRTWFDGDAYWLSDGFQRVAAAELVGLKVISAEVVRGTLEEARWDSYAANSSHGLRRSRADIEVIIRRALEHPKGSHLSNRELARQLSLPEPTIRRWRRRVSASPDADTIRIAVRAGLAYPIETANIKKSGELRRHREKSLEDLRREFNTIKQLASPHGRILLTIIGSWIFESAPATVCLDRIEEAVRELSLVAGKRELSARN